MISHIQRIFAISLCMLAAGPKASAFDIEAWKNQYGTALTPSQFYSSRPGPWGDYFNSTSTDCANATFLYLGPLGVKARPYDQALSTAAFAALYPPALVDASGLVQNAFGVMDVPAGAPADGSLYPGDVLLEIEDQRIKTASDISFPFPIQAKSSRGLEIHAGQLVDLAEGRGAVKFKVIRAAKTAWSGGTLTAPSTSSEVVIDVTGHDFVRLITSSSDNALTNWIEPRIENGASTLYLNAQTINQKSGYASPVMGKDATNATVNDGSTAVTNCIGTRSNSMIEYAIPAGYTSLKFKVQTTGSGSIQPKIGLRKATLATTPPNPRQYDANGAPVLAPELAPYLETVEFSIPQIGSFGSTYDPNSEKVANYAAILAERLAREQNADGSWPSAGGDYADGSFRTSLAGLGLLATGDPAFNTHLQKAANYCANVTPSGWAYPRGTRLMFLAEYYLRTKDAAILPGLQKAVTEAEWMITADFTCGHGLNMGYGGAGYIGATGTIGTGLAIASKCPVIVDMWKLDNLLERVQELAGGNGGQLPYSRGGIGRNSFPETPSAGQSYSCGAGGVLATKIRGGPQYITELFRKKFGSATTYGDADGGHASEALTFIMGSLACQIWGDEAHQANMNRFLWRLTLKRDYSGYINLNTNRLEFHGGDGGVHGGPTYDTGGYLVLLNSHKHNLAITGKPEHQATVFPDTPPTYDVDRKLYWRVLNDWNMVDAALGSKMPVSLQPKLEELRSMTLGTDLATRTLAFLQREALSAATLVNAVSGLTSPEKQHYCEMLLGIGHDITAVSIDDPVPASGLSNYRFSLKGYTATTTWDAWGGPTLPSDPASTTQMSGSVTLIDPSGLYLTTPRVLNFSNGSLNPTTDFQVPVTSQVTFTATFNYTVGGSLPITYTRDIIINPSVPFNVDGRAGNYTNMRKVWIPGNCPIPFEKWNMPVQLPSGITLPGASKNEGTIGFHTYDNGTLVSADNVYKAKIRGKPAGYWAVSSDIWGECAILGVNLLSGPVITTTVVSAINPTTATSGGNVTSDSGWPVTRRGICWSTSPYPTIYDAKSLDGSATGSFPSNLTGLEPGTVYHVRAYATNAIGTSYGENLSFSTSGSSGVWTTNGGGSWPVTTNWQGGVDASGADGIADFSTVTPASDATVTLDGPRAIGGMVFGNAGFSNNWILNSGANGSLSLDIGTSGDPTITVNGGGAVLNTPLLGVDGLVKAGVGSLTLTAANTYTGLTSVNAGTLHVTGTISAGSPIIVGASGTLGGTGSLGSHVTVSGNVSPGAGGIGTLTVGGKLTLAGTATMEINKTSATCDKISGSTLTTYGGTLTVTNLAGTLTAGDKFILFPSSAYAGAFATFNLPALTSGLKWDTGGLLVDGSILVGFDAAISGQPTNQSVGQGVSATFSVTATGLPVPSYQWQVSTNGGGSWADIVGATSASHNTVATVSGDSGKQFRCVVSNELATATSNAATLTVTSNSLPVFTVQPNSVFHAAAGQSVSFSATASGTPAPTYQWQVSTNAGAAWSNVSGATSATYSFTSVLGDNNKAYRCVATNSQGSANSNLAQFIIATDPTWINPAGGSWPVSSNWTNNSIASGSGVTADFSRLILPAAPTITLDGARTIGNMKFGDAASLQSSTLATGSGGSLTLAVSSGLPTITVNNQTTTISASLAGNNGLTKAGAGNLILTGSNTHAGGTILAAGTLTLNNTNALGGGALTITGGTLANSSGSSLTLPGTQAWNGNFTYAGPNNMTLSGAVTLNANRIVTVEGGDLTVSGAIGGAFSLTKSGTSTLTLSTGSTYSGGTIVNAGKLLATAGGWYGTRSIGTGTLTVNTGAIAQFTNAHGFGVDPGGRSATVSGGMLQFDAENYMSGLTMTGGSIIGNGEIRMNSNLTVPINASASGAVIAVGINLVSGTTTFNVANGAAATDLLVSDGISNVGNLVKTGTGFMKLTGPGTYSGTTTISAGTLQLAGGSLGGGTVTVASAATLAGSGTVGGASTINGPLMLGVDGAIGTLAFSNSLTLASTSQTTMKIQKSGTSLSNDMITTGGTLTCGGTLTVSASGDALGLGDTIQLFSSPAFSGTFSTVTLPALSGGLVWDTSKLYIDGSISLGKLPQTINFASLSTMSVGDVIALDASASSGLPVTFTSSNPAVGLLQFGNYLITYGAGTTTITASQSGNAFYQPATDVNRTLTVSASLPAVSTVSLVPITTTSATSGGTNIWDGGDTITERGVCWGTSANPTVAGNRTLDGTGTGNFTSTITGLTSNVTYHIRAYVKNSAGYGYGEDVAFNAPVVGVWILNANGNWSTAANWSGGLIPQGYGSTANFATLNITGDRTVTLDVEASLGSMTFGDLTTASHNWILAPGTGSLAMTALTGTPSITVNNQTATINTPIAGTMGLTKAGPGTLALGAYNPLTGPISITGGIVRQTTNNTFAPDASLNLTNSALEVRYGLYNINWVDVENLTLGGGATLRAASQYAADNGDIGFKDNITVVGTNTVSATGGSYGKHNWLSGGMTGGVAAYVNLTNGAGYGAYADRRAIILESLYGDWTGYQGTLRAVNDVTIKGAVELKNAKVIVDGTIGLYANGAIGEFGELSGAGTLEANAKTGGQWKIGNLGTNSTYAGVINGASQLTKVGTGALTLTNASTHTGGTNISEGALLANNTTGSATGTGIVTVASGALLGGTGIITGPTSIAGTLAPGSNAIGTLTINNTVSLAGTTTLELNKTGATLTHDKLQGVTTLTYGGTLTVTAAGDALTAGSTFTLFSASTYAGTFSSITLPPLGSGLQWDTSSLGTNGSITIISTKPVVTVTATGTPAEAGPVSAQFTISRDLSVGDLTVYFTASGTATVGSDYVALPASVTIPDGAASATVTLTPVDDALLDVGETVILTLTSDAEYVLGTPDSATLTITDNDGPQPVGPPWTAQDVGTVAGSNQSTVTNGGGTNGTALYSITGSGTLNTANSTDGMRFVSQVVTGDCEIIARVASHSGTGTNQRVGVAIRADLSGGSVSAQTLLRGGNRQPYFLYRATANNAGSSSQLSSTVTAPYWVKLVRTGSSFSSYVSANGSTWAQISTATTLANMPTSARIGLFVSSGSTTATNTATFDNVTIKQNLVSIIGPASPAAEGTPVQTAEFTVSRGDSPPASALTLPLTLAGTATHGTDYSFSGGSVSVVGATATVIIPAGQNSIALTATPLNDLVNDDAETIDLTVPTGSTYSLGTETTASTTITNAPVAGLTTTSNPTEGGTTSGSGTFFTGSTQPITATPASGWQFVNWTGTGITDSNSSSTTVSIDSAKTITANFVPITHVLIVTASPIEGGSVTGAGTYNQGSTQPITATPASGWQFVNWTGTGITDPNNSSTTVSIEAEKTITANFVPITHALSVTASPIEGGNVTGVGIYNQGSTQPITATPASGWQFVNWTGTGITDPNSASTTVIIEAAKTVTANFAPITHALSVSASPSEGGNVTGAGTYNQGSTQPITAIPASGWQFVNWTGTGITDSNSSSTGVSIDAAKTVTAIFVPITHALTITASPNEGGNVTGGGTYNQGSTQPITATPASGWQFVNWTGTGITDPNNSSTTVSIDVAKTVTANFVKITHALTVTASPSEGGTVAGSGTYNQGSIQPITATPASGWQFVNWTGTGITDSNNSSTTVSIDSAKTITANFVPITHALTVTASPSEGGNVTGGGTYSQGSIQPITATPSSGWQFVNWSGSGISDPNSSSTTVSIDAAKTVTANFTQINPDANSNGILDTWESEKFGNANPGVNLPDADADGDGLSNLLEFALDTHPLQANASPLTSDLETVGAGRYLRLTVPKNPAATNLVFAVEVSGDLAPASWTQAQTVIEENTASQLRVRDTVNAASGASRFIRLKVSTNP